MITSSSRKKSSNEDEKRKTSSNEDEKGKKSSNEDEKEKKKKSRKKDEKGEKSSDAGSSDKKYKGVRQRKYIGRPKEEEEIFLGTNDSAEEERPKKKKPRKIWLGTYDTFEEAARTHDAATVCIHGSQTEVPGDLYFPDAPLEIPNSGDQPFSKEQIQQIARQHATGVGAGPVQQPAQDTGEHSNEMEVEEENENVNPIDWSFMDEKNQDDNPILPRQAGLDFSGYVFLPSPESAPENQVLDNAEEEEEKIRFVELPLIN